MFGLGLPELIAILAIVVLLFGAKRLPMIGEGMGKAIRGFKKGIDEPDSSDDNSEDKKEQSPPPGGAG